MTVYSSDSDFATALLSTTNTIERCLPTTRALGGQNNKEAQLNQIHRAMHHRSHQAEY